MKISNFLNFVEINKQFVTTICIYFSLHIQCFKSCFTADKEVNSGTEIKYYFSSEIQVGRFKRKISQPLVTSDLYGGQTDIP